MRLDPDLLDDADQLAAGPAKHEPSVFGDIPHAIWIAYLSAWALLFGLFLLFFTGDGQAALAVLTSSFFALMLLGLPAALGTQTRAAPRGLPRTIVTRSGVLPVASAATQILLIPLAAVIGVAGFVLFAM
jgi:hypothetical protein